MQYAVVSFDALSCRFDQSNMTFQYKTYQTIEGR